MTDSQILEFMREYEAEVQVKANNGSPVCCDLLDHYKKMRGASNADLSRIERYMFEACVKEYLEFKSKGWI